MAQIQRYDYIDTFKGGAMICVILWHSCFLTLFYKHSVVSVPLFFIISGLFYKENLSWKELLIRNIKLLLIPYLAYNFLKLLIFKSLSLLGVNVADASVLTIFYPLSAESVPNVATWYLLVLFIVVPLFKVLFMAVKLMASKWQKIILLLVLLLIGYSGYILAQNNIRLPWLMDIVPIGLLFYGIGYLVSSMQVLLPKAKYDWLGYSLIIPLFGVYLFLRKYVSMASGTYDLPYVQLVVMIMSLFVSLFYLCKAVGYVPIITYIGRYSLIALCTHMIMIPLSMGVTLRFFDYNTAVVVTSIATIILLRWCVIPFCIRFLPWISGIRSL